MASTRELLETYYRGLAQKAGWESVIADDFKFVGGDMMNPTPVTGKAAYLAVIARFSRLFTAMRPTQMIIEGDRAYVCGNYDYVFPNGHAINASVAEIWTVKDGKLSELTIFFDTAGFQANLKPA